MNITGDIDNITQQKKKSERYDRQEDRQKDRKIPFEENEKNNIIIASEKFEPNASTKIKQIASKTFDVR